MNKLYPIIGGVIGIVAIMAFVLTSPSTAIMMDREPETLEEGLDMVKDMSLQDMIDYTEKHEDEIKAEAEKELAELKAIAEKNRIERERQEEVDQLKAEIAEQERLDQERAERLEREQAEQAEKEAFETLDCDGLKAQILELVFSAGDLSGQEYQKLEDRLVNECGN